MKSLVKVRFQCKSIDLAYYNDRFDLKKGDVVYVSGKLAGEPGIVTSVTTKFCIHSNEYERVLALLDLTLHGTFTRIQNMMVSIDNIAITPDQFGIWVTPPEDPKKKKDPDVEPDEIITGDGYSIDIHHIEQCEDLTEAVAHRAIDYCSNGNVRYLCVHNGVGRAYVEGTKWYRVDFRLSEDGWMTDIFCDCPYPGLCKHEVAVAIMIRMLSQQSQLTAVRDFVALDRFLFWQLASRTDTITL